ncbi:hypothetical protein ACP179_01975 (plasmid) [Xenorhabdus stockiae]|uniref:hypothetical protein n=1 Tax=Xenorhabdus stockiae TaxID=351614 RepID=UPI003CF9085F
MKVIYKTNRCRQDTLYVTIKNQSIFYKEKLFIKKMIKEQIQNREKTIGYFLKSIIELKQLDIIDNIDSLTLSQLQEELLKQSKNGTRLKQQFIRHGAKWEEEEEEELESLFLTGELNIEKFAEKYQRRPKSVTTRMTRLGLIEE